MAGSYGGREASGPRHAPSYVPAGSSGNAESSAPAFPVLFPAKDANRIRVDRRVMEADFGTRNP